MLFLDIILASTAIKTPKRSSYMNPALNECNILTQIKFVANIMEIISSSIFFSIRLKMITFQGSTSVTYWFYTRDKATKGVKKSYLSYNAEIFREQKNPNEQLAQ